MKNDVGGVELLARRYNIIYLRDRDWMEDGIVGEDRDFMAHAIRL